MIFFRDRTIDKLFDTTLLAYRVLIASTLGLIYIVTLFLVTMAIVILEIGWIYWVIIAVASVAASTSVVYIRAKAIINIFPTGNIYRFSNIDAGYKRVYL